jgi:hypothetical protein
VLFQVKEACNKILTQLDSTPFAQAPVPAAPEPKAPGQKRLVGRVILVPPYAPGWFARGFFSVWSWRRRLQAGCCAFVLLGLLALAIAIGVVVNNSHRNLSVILAAAVTATTTPTTPTSVGSIQLDVAVQLSRPATLWYAVIAANRPDPDSSDVVEAAGGSAITAVSNDALACGVVFVPIAKKNFTFTITPTSAISECSMYDSLEATVAEARMRRCSRCPKLPPNTPVKVLSVLQRLENSDSHDEPFHLKIVSYMIILIIDSLLDV